MTGLLIFIQSLTSFVALSIALHLLFPELDVLTIAWAAIAIDVSYILYPGRKQC